MEEMLFMISHKVRQPIANILGIASLLDSQVNSPEETLKMVGYINESTKSIDIFAKELTSFIEETKSQKHKDLAQ